MSLVTGRFDPISCCHSSGSPGEQTEVGRNIMNVVATRALGIAAVMAASAVLGGCSLIGGIVEGATGTDPFKNSDPFSIKVGDCFMEPDFSVDDTVSEIAFVECTVAHDDEAYASVLLSDATFPGLEAAGSKAEDACYDRFFDFVGAPPDYDGSLNYGYFYPTQESWDGGDREILCYAFDDAGTTVGSLKDSLG
jgi:hypothetical protein